MKRLLLLPFTAVLLPSALCAQSADADIERTLLAAPASLRAEATILELRPDGSTGVFRGGSNGLICWDNEGRPGQMAPLDVGCTAEAIVRDWSRTMLSRALEGPWLKSWLASSGPRPTELVPCPCGEASTTTCMGTLPRITETTPWWPCLTPPGTWASRSLAVRPCFGSWRQVRPARISWFRDDEIATHAYLYVPISSATSANNFF